MSENSKERQIIVEGMTCTNCALSVTKKLEKLGLNSVNTDFISGEVRFSGDLEFEEIKSELKKIGYDALTEKTEEESGKISGIEKKFIFSLIFTLPLLAHMFLGHDSILNSALVQFFLCLPVYLLGAIHFGKSGWGSLRSGIANMDVLIFIGSTAAFVYSIWGSLSYWGTHEVHNYLFFETAATIITLVFLGNVLEHRSVSRTTTAIRELSSLQKVNAKKIINTEKGESIVEIQSEYIQKDDILQVNSGDRIPVDGIVISGNGYADESMITGESRSILKSMGQNVIGGTILLEGTIRISATKIGKDSTLSKIITLVKQAQTQKPQLQKLSDKVSAIFVPAVVAISMLTFVLSYFVFDISIQQALMQSIAVLVISCPCAMGLATPTAVVSGVGRAAKNGIMIKGGDTLERFSKIKQIVFDKTGTLTTGEFEIKSIRIVSDDSKEFIESVLFSIEKNSSHPLAKSIVKSLQQRSGSIELFQINEIKGKGIQAIDSDNTRWAVGSSRMYSAVSEAGLHEIVIWKNEKPIAYVGLKDEIKPGAKAMISQLKNHGIEPILLSGDKNENCKTVAEELGILQWYGEQLPEEKLEKMKALNKEKFTAMVGDGINDAPALSASYLGISPSLATDVAINAAQVVLLTPNIQAISDAYLISKHTMLTIKQNLFWAFFYNVIAIPIAAIGWLNPMIGSLSMAFSDVIVVGNSIRLQKKKLR